MDPCLLLLVFGSNSVSGWAGGGEWHGAAFDPLTGLYYVPSASGPIVVQLTEADPSESNLIYRRGGARSVSGPQGLPLQSHLMVE